MREAIIKSGQGGADEEEPPKRDAMDEKLRPQRLAEIWQVNASLATTGAHTALSVDWLGTSTSTPTLELS